MTGVTDSSSAFKCQQGHMLAFHDLACFSLKRVSAAAKYHEYQGRREDPMSIPQSTLVRICERKVSQIFYKRDCSRFVRRFLQNLTSESKFVRGKSHKSSKIPGVMCPPSTGGSHAGGFVRRSSHKSAGPEYRPSTSRAIVR